jgi:hypothetical protein
LRELRRAPLDWQLSLRPEETTSQNDCEASGWARGSQIPSALFTACCRPIKAGRFGKLDGETAKKLQFPSRISHLLIEFRHEEFRVTARRSSDVRGFLKLLRQSSMQRVACRHVGLNLDCEESFMNQAALHRV